MKKYFLIVLILISIQAIAQNNHGKDYLPEIKKHDISGIFTREYTNDAGDIEGGQQPIGFIGNNYQRLNMRFLSVIKNPVTKTEYLVYGKSRVKNNICTFQGKITITKSEIYQSDEFPQFQEGFISGTYIFYEDPNQTATGTFAGNFITYFYIDENNKIQYNDLMFAADGFENNQFEGTWTSYKSGTTKICNWGDYRIPNSDDLDIGVGEFSPNDKYLDFGWKTYRLAWLYSGSEQEIINARKKETEKWWIDKN